MNEVKNEFTFDNNEGLDSDSKPGQKLLDKRQKISLIALGFFTVFVLIFGFFRFRYNIYSPFDYSKQIAASQKNKSANITADATNTDLSKVDSDKDGLNDYDEINVYSTSPYLEDSDSDGFNDQEEILNGTDPNCPAGQVCAQISVPTDSASSTTTISSPDVSSGVELTAEEQLAQDLLNGKSDPAVLRKMLLDNGMDKAELDQINDEDLVAGYQESLQKQAEAQAAQ